MIALDVCSSCGRHIKRSERVCPFCETQHLPGRPLPALPFSRMGRARWMLIVSATSLANCNGKESVGDARAPEAALDATNDGAATTDDTASSNENLDGSVLVLDMNAATSFDASREADFLVDEDVTQRADAIQEPLEPATDANPLDGLSEANPVQPDAGIDVCSACPPGTTPASVLDFVETGSVPTIAPGIGCAAIWEHCGEPGWWVAPPPDDAGQCVSGYISSGASCSDPCSWSALGHSAPACAGNLGSCPNYLPYAIRGTACWPQICYGCPPMRPELSA